jgi:cobalamin biosynthesis Mg chelatase CobN
MTTARRTAAGTVSVLVLMLTMAIPAFAQADLDCDDFSSQAEAQAVLDTDPSDPNDLDRDNDGKACENFGYSGATSTGGGTRQPTRVDTGAGGAADLVSSSQSNTQRAGVMFIAIVALMAAVCGIRKVRDQ